MSFNLKPCSFQGEPLIEHLLRSMNIVEKNFSERYYRIIARRISIATGEKYNCEEIAYSLNTSILLHDIGKAAEVYQRNFNDKCECKYKRFFELHEIPSSIITFNSLKDRVDYDLAELASLSVLLHMSSFRPFNKILYRLKSFSRENSDGWIFSKYTKERLSNILEKYSLDASILIDISPREAEKFLYEKKKYIDSFKTPSKLYILFLAPIVIGDNLSAFKFRANKIENKSRNTFMSELCRVIDFE